jgi:Domain of unknown function (DUF4164)
MKDHRFERPPLNWKAPTSRQFQVGPRWLRHSIWYEQVNKSKASSGHVRQFFDICPRRYTKDDFGENEGQSCKKLGVHPQNSACRTSLPLLTHTSRVEYCYKSDKWPNVVIRNLGGDRKDMMPTGKTVDAALDGLRQAIAALDNAVDMRFERERERGEMDGEVRRIHTDRSRLAQELDQAEFRANRLEEVNREVSRRLVTAMETIRAVLDR